MNSTLILQLASKYLMIVTSEINTNWSGMPYPEIIPAQIEQETCGRVSDCWNPRAVNRNSRNNNEFGAGLGQTTRTSKFDKFGETEQRFKSMKGYSVDIYNPTLQIRSIVLWDRVNFNKFDGKTPIDRHSMALVSYNAGTGNVLKRRSLCRYSPGCDPTVWKGNLELQGLNKTKLPGYSRSAYEISTEYPNNIIYIRRNKYIDPLSRLMKQ